MTLEENYFQLVKEASFTAIRLPIKWSAHALSATPYTIDETLFKRVDCAIRNATCRGLSIIVNMHHYGELLTGSVAHLERFLALWQQIASRFKNQSDQVFLEILNEPNGKLEPLWNDCAARALAVIRQSNPKRAVIIGPNGYNAIGRTQAAKRCEFDRDRAFLRSVFVHASRRRLGHAHATDRADFSDDWHQPATTLAELPVGQYGDLQSGLEY